jgi:hypothetical protein
MVDTTVVGTFDELVKYLGARRHTEYDPDEQTVLIATSHSELAGGKVLVKWDNDYPMVHITQPMICDVPGEHADNVARAICRLGYASSQGELRYDEAARTIFFRWSLAREKEGIHADQVLDLALGVAQAAQGLLPAMKAVAGGASVEESIDHGP